MIIICMYIYTKNPRLNTKVVHRNNNNKRAFTPSVTLVSYRKPWIGKTILKYATCFLPTTNAKQKNSKGEHAIFLSSVERRVGRLQHQVGALRHCDGAGPRDRVAANVVLLQVALQGFHQAGVRLRAKLGPFPHDPGRGGVVGGRAVDP